MPPLYQCPFCNHKTMYKICHHNHLNIRHGTAKFPTSFRFQCEYCNFGSDSKLHFNKHVFTQHHQALSYECISVKPAEVETAKMETAVETVAMDLSLKDRDIKNLAEDSVSSADAATCLKVKVKKLYSCAFCKSVVNSEDKWNRHMKRKHADVLVKIGLEHIPVVATTIAMEC